jgi:hypothetical protein
MLGLISTDQIEGIFRGIHWKVRRLSNWKWCVEFVMSDGAKPDSTSNFSLAECFQMVYVTGIRLGKDC